MVDLHRSGAHRVPLWPLGEFSSCVETQVSNSSKGVAKQKVMKMEDQT